MPVGKFWYGTWLIGDTPERRWQVPAGLSEGSSPEPHRLSQNDLLKSWFAGDPLCVPEPETEGICNAFGNDSLRWLAYADTDHEIPPPHPTTCPTSRSSTRPLHLLLPSLSYVIFSHKQPCYQLCLGSAIWGMHCNSEALSVKMKPFSLK